MKKQNKIKIGINGFGRIGRLALRTIEARDNVEVVAVNDPFITADYAEYLLCNDSIHGHYDKKVSNKKDTLIIDGRAIKFYAEKDPTMIPWGKHDVDVVIEATGKFTDAESCEMHIKAGAKRVVVSAPGKNMPMFVMGVNEKTYKKSMKIVSNASCTTNCLAPLAKVLNDHFGIEGGLMTTVHSTTATQLTVDGPSKKDWRGGRAASYNIIPSTTGAAKAVGKVLPELDGKLTGMSVRVPTLDVSLVDLTVNLKKATTYEEICAVMKKEAKGKLKGILATTDKPVVSSDFIGDSHTCIFDELGGIMLTPKYVKVLAWYDNEWGYTQSLVSLAEHIAK